MFKIYNTISGISGRINSWAWMRSVILLDQIRKEEDERRNHDSLQHGWKEGEVRLHNRFHPTRWKKGFASYHFHMPMEYEILETGQESGYENTITTTFVLDL